MVRVMVARGDLAGEGEIVAADDERVFEVSGARAARRLESTPPERNRPTGVAALDWDATARRRAGRSAGGAAAAER